MRRSVQYRQEIGDVSSVIVSSEDLLYDVAVDIGETKIPTGVFVSEFEVIDSQKMQHRGMKIVHMKRVVDGGESKRIGFPIGGASLNISGYSIIFMVVKYG